MQFPIPGTQVSNIYDYRGIGLLLHSILILQAIQQVWQDASKLNLKTLVNLGQCVAQLVGLYSCVYICTLVQVGGGGGRG